MSTGSPNSFRLSPLLFSQTHDHAGRNRGGSGVPPRDLNTKGRDKTQLGHKSGTAPTVIKGVPKFPQPLAKYKETNRLSVRGRRGGSLVLRVFNFGLPEPKERLAPVTLSTVNPGPLSVLHPSWSRTQKTLRSLPCRYLFYGTVTSPVQTRGTDLVLLERKFRLNLTRSWSPSVR